MREATVEDAAAISALSKRVFVETFVEEFAIPYAPEDLAAFLDHAHGELALHSTIHDPHAGAWVAEVDGRIVGYATAGPMGLPHPRATVEDMELYRLYVAREFHGAGVATRLMEAALSWMEARAATLWIGVWSENLRAQRFYARYGFEKAGEYDFPVGATIDREFILQRIGGSQAPR